MSIFNELSNGPSYRSDDDFKELQPPKIPPAYRNYQPAQPSVGFSTPKPTRNAAKKSDGLWLTARDAAKARERANSKTKMRASK